MEWVKNSIPLLAETLEETIYSKWGVRFSKDVIEVLANNNSGNVFNKCIKVNSEEYEFGCFLDFRKDEFVGIGALRSYELNRDFFPNNFYPFGLDGSGNYFGLIKNETLGFGVGFWDHEGFVDEEGRELYKFVVLTDSFYDFINCLSSCEELDW